MLKDWGRTITNPYDFAQIDPDSTISYRPNQLFEDPLLSDSDDLRCLSFPGCNDLLEHAAGDCASAEKIRWWKEAILVLGCANCVVFIGYSLPSYDLEAREQLELVCRNKSVIVCNPSNEVIEAFRRAFRQSKIAPRPNKFEESRFGGIR
jgi:hypothetical protein